MIKVTLSYLGQQFSHLAVRTLPSRNLYMCIRWRQPERSERASHAVSLSSNLDYRFAGSETELSLTAFDFMDQPNAKARAIATEPRRGGALTSNGTAKPTAILEPSVQFSRNCIFRI